MQNKSTYKEREIQIKWKHKLTNVFLVEVTCNVGAYFDDISSFFFINAMGNRCYIKTTDIKIAQLVCDAYTGSKGHYTVRSLKADKVGKRPLSARQ